MWAMPSGAVPHSLHAELLLSLTRALWMVYNRVGNSSNMPAMVCVGQVGQSLSHQKYRSALSSSSLSLSVTSFHCHLCSLSSSRTLDSRCLLRRFFTFFQVSPLPLWHRMDQSIQAVAVDHTPSRTPPLPLSVLGAPRSPHARQSPVPSS